MLKFIEKYLHSLISRKILNLGWLKKKKKQVQPQNFKELYDKMHHK